MLSKLTGMITAGLITGLRPGVSKNAASHVVTPDFPVFKRVNPEFKSYGLSDEGLCRPAPQCLVLYNMRIDME